MEELINKLKEFTQDGPPGVGQRIELSDLAKKVGVKRVELEKLIDKAVANGGNVMTPSVAELNKLSEEVPEEEKSEERVFERPTNERSRMTEYERPDLDSARESFEKELKIRQQLEQDKLYEVAPEIEQPDVVFPELNVTFGNEVPKDDSPRLEDIEMPEIVQEELKSAFDVPEIPVSKIEVKRDDFQSTSEGSITFEPSRDQPIVEEEETAAVDDLDFYGNAKTKVSFGDKIKNTQERLDKEDVLRKIIAENKHAKEDAERESTAYSKKQAQSKSRSRTQSKSKSNADTVTLEQSKSSKITGIVAFVAAILPFSIIGLIAGIYGYTVAKKHKENIESNPSIYGSTITNNIKLGFYLSIAGAVLGGFRMLAVFF